jgi:2-oxoisovalerate dehydrogenase E1 component
VRGESSGAKSDLIKWLDHQQEENRQRFNSNVCQRNPEFTASLMRWHLNMMMTQKWLTDVLCFATILIRLFEKFPNTLVFGEDVGKLGDVNLGLEGMQEKYGELRVSDAGIREATILGQGIGMSLRGLRPIAEIQYLDYLLYCFQGLSDDVATVRYRTSGGQAYPLIVRTRGHRLEGIWHSGSPMGMIINGVRGVHVCVPRNLTQAAGFYNTLIQGDDPALIIEPLNGYRLKEKLPNNPGEFTTPLGIPEVVSKGMTSPSFRTDQPSILSKGCFRNLKRRESRSS